jgi:hypothetical protein
LYCYRLRETVKKWCHESLKVLRDIPIMARLSDVEGSVPARGDVIYTSKGAGFDPDDMVYDPWIMEDKQ